MAKAIPPEELQYWYVTGFKDKDGRLLFEIEHVSEMDWRQPDFMSVSMHEVVSQMKLAKRN